MPLTGGFRRGAAQIPAPTVARLPVYHRALAVMAEERRVTVSSNELSVVAGVNAATLRRDLCRLGSLGTPGQGYDVAHLLSRIDRALALDREWPVAIVGVGNLGRALTGFWAIACEEFDVVALLDVDPAVIGSTVAGVVVSDLEQIEEVVTQRRIAIGVIATPAAAAQMVASRLVASGVASILNFAPVGLATPEGVNVRHVDLAAELQVLAFYGSRAMQHPAHPRRVRPLPAV